MYTKQKIAFPLGWAEGWRLNHQKHSMSNPLNNEKYTQMLNEIMS